MLYTVFVALVEFIICFHD